MNRRALLTSSLSLLASATALAALGGCGFQLRAEPTMAFRTVTLAGFASSSPMATELARALEASGVDVVETTAQAAAMAAADPALRTSGGQPSPVARHVILEAQLDSRDQIAAGTTAYGQVRDLSLRNRLIFRLLRADGSVIVPPTEVALARDLTYNEKDALAKQNESEALHRAMQTDLVAQVMRRLAAVRPDQLSQP